MTGKVARIRSAQPYVIGDRLTTWEPVSESRRARLWRWILRRPPPARVEVEWVCVSAASEGSSWIRP